MKSTLSTWLRSDVYDECIMWMVKFNNEGAGSLSVKGAVSKICMSSSIPS